MLRRRALSYVLVACMILPAALSLAQSTAAQTTDKAAILLAINRARLASGVTPLALNPALENAAQAYSNDMAARRSVDRIGSNESSSIERIRASGYPAWQRSRVWAENVFAGSQGFTEALDYFLKDETQKASIVSPRYREVGIGAQVAMNSAGVQMTYWTITVGSQPNVLPVFINDGAALATSPQVAIHLTQEEAVPAGEEKSIGSVIEARMSTSPSFQNVLWRRWEALIPFTFDPLPGPKTIYVQLRDAGGRIAGSTASIQYDPKGTPQPSQFESDSQGAQGNLSKEGHVITPTPFHTPVPIHALPPESLPGEAGGSRVKSPTDRIVVRTPLPQATPTQMLNNGANSTYPDWLLPVYLIFQSGVVIAGVYWFFALKGPSRS